MTNEAKRSKMDQTRAVVAPCDIDVISRWKSDGEGFFDGGLAGLKGVDSNDFAGQSTCETNALVEDGAGAVDTNPCLCCRLCHPSHGMTFVDDRNPFLYRGHEANVVVSVACEVGDFALT